MKEADFSKMYVCMYQTMQCFIPECHIWNTWHYKK